MATKEVKPGQPQTLVKLGSSTKNKSQIDGGKCTHYGNTKHTRDTCFKLHGYLDWWHELQSRKKKDNTTIEEGMGWATMVITKPQLSLIPMVDLLLQSTIEVIVDRFCVAPALEIMVSGSLTPRPRITWPLTRVTFLIQHSHDEFASLTSMGWHILSQGLESCPFHHLFHSPTRFLFHLYQTNWCQ